MIAAIGAGAAIPMCVVFRNRIVAARVERVAATNSPRTKPATTQHAEAFDRFHGV